MVVFQSLVLHLLTSSIVIFGKLTVKNTTGLMSPLLLGGLLLINELLLKIKLLNVTLFQNSK